MVKKRKLDVLIICKDDPSATVGGIATHVDYLSHGLSNLYNSTRKVCNVHILTDSTEETSFKFRNENFLTIHRVPFSKPLINEKTICQNISFPCGNNDHRTCTFKKQLIVKEEGILFTNPVKYFLMKARKVSEERFSFKKINPDIIHVHDEESAYIGLQLKAILNIPLVMTIHRAPHHWEETLPLKDTKEKFYHIINTFNIVNKYIAPSTAYKNMLLKRGIKSNKIKKILHGVSLKLKTYSNYFSILPLDLENKFLILCPARIDRNKNIHVLIRAAKKIINKQLCKMPLFWIAGKGTCMEKKEVENLAIQYNVRKYFYMKEVKFEEMPTLYRKADVCVLPSRREGFGQVILEAFLFDKPVVGTNIGGITDIIKPEHNGLLFQDDKEDDLANQIYRLLTDYSLKKRLIKKAQRDIQDKFTSSIMAKNYFKFYSKEVNIDMTEMP